MAEKNMDRVSPIQVQKYLKGIHYPVSKQDIVKTAKTAGADERMLKVLQALPEKSYTAPTEVTKALGKAQ